MQGDLPMESPASIFKKNSIINDNNEIEKNERICKILIINFQIK
jgi:hypothetical protein